MSSDVHPQPGWEMNDPAHTLTAFLESLPALPQLLALGEPTHQIEDFPAWRNTIFRTLVENHGYRSIALESDSYAGLKVNEYVTSGTGSLDEVMQQGFSHGFGKVRANRDLALWLREYNKARDPAEQVRFYGFDAPLENLWASSPRHALSELHTFLAEHLEALPADSAFNRDTLLELCGDDARWTNEAAGMDPAQSIGASGEAKQLRWLTDDLLTLLKTERPRLAAQPEAFWHARLHARTAQGLLRYHAVMATPSPNRVARMLSLRDTMMADNLEAITEREAKRGPTLVFAHNSHLQRHYSRWTYGGLDLLWVPAGFHVSARLGERYAFIATAVGKGTELAVPPAETLEGWLNRRASTPHLYATARLTATLNKRTDTSEKPGTTPLESSPLSQTDGILFLPAPAPQP